MDKIDLKKTLPDYFKPSKGEFSILNFPKYNYLMVDGEGDPNLPPQYVEAIELLHGVSHMLKFTSKNNLGQEYIVPPLEGLWWAKDTKTFVGREKSMWLWTMMIMVPSSITKANVIMAIKAFQLKEPAVKTSKLAFRSFTEGLSLQVLHVGGYDAVGPVLAKIHNEFMPQNGYTFNGKHHEIYLSNPQNTQPSKLKTILRQPVKKI